MTHNTGNKIIIPNIEAFNELFESHYEWACAVTSLFIHDFYAVEDIVSESFMIIWEKKEIIYGPLRPYLLKIIQNKSLNYIRNLKAQAKFKNGFQEKMLDYQENFILQTEHPFSYVDRKEMSELIHSAIDKLPPKCRQIFLLNHFEDKTYNEIAEILHISENTIKTQMKIAFVKLKESLQDVFVLLFFI